MAERLLFFTIEFQNQIKRLVKRYRHIRSDVEPVLEKLKKGETPGEQLQGIKHRIYKVRISNRDAQREKVAAIALSTIFTLKAGLF